MSLLEDRILRIIELKRSKKDDVEIAQELGVLPAMVFEYEESVKRAFKKAFDRGYSDNIRLAKLIDISPAAVDIIMAYYDLTPSLPERRQEITSSAGVRTAFAPFRGACAGDTPAIAEAIRLGQEFAGSLDELSRQLQLSKCRIREHVKKYGIKLRFEEDALIKKSSRKKQKKPIYVRKGDILKEIFDNPDSGELSLDDLCAKVITSPRGISVLAGRYHLYLPPTIMGELIRRRIRRPEPVRAFKKLVENKTDPFADELSRDLLTKDQQQEFLSTFDGYITQLAG